MDDTIPPRPPGDSISPDAPKSVHPDSGLSDTSPSLKGTNLGLEATSPSQRPAAVLSNVKPTPARLPDLTYHAGSKVGRFILLNPLGSGGMGVVWTAYDPQLDRKVALKFLRADTADTETTARLMREAQALARVNHPNVVAVHDVGNGGGQLYIAQEFVRGQDLSDWLTQPHTQAEVLGVFLQAARGLAGAHAAGIVHRDFKPANVLLGEDGRARVLDFGLARSVNDSPETAKTPSPNAVPSILDSALTQAGTVMGTPLYMSPEQHRGDLADAQSDQFSFCIALYQALYGDTPFEGATYPELRQAVLGEKWKPLPKGNKVPGWIRDVLLRGLQANPKNRFPSMDALIVALERDPRAGRIRRGVTAGVALVLVIASALGIQQLQAHRQLCKGAERKLTDIWDLPRQKVSEAAFRAVPLPYAESSWTHVKQSLDEYSRDWAAMHTATCEATRLRGEQSEEVMDLRMICLDQRLQELKASTDLLANADKNVVERAVQMTSGLDSLSGCADVEALKAPMRPPRDADVRNQVEATRAEIARAKALEASGQTKLGLESADKALAAARKIGYPPLLAEALFKAGELNNAARIDALSVAQLEEAIFVAEGCRHDAVAVDASTLLANHLGVNLEELTPAHRWTRLAAAIIQRGDTEPLLEAHLRLIQGTLLRVEGKYDEALKEFEVSLMMFEKLLGPDALSLARVRTSIGTVLRLQSKLPEAIAEFRRALAIVEKIEGPEHPDAAAIHSNLSSTLDDMVKYDEAMVEAKRAIEIQEKSYGPLFPEIAGTLTTEATILWHQTKYPESLALLRDAEDLLKKTVGLENPDVLPILGTQGNVLAATGRFDEAVTVMKRALLLRISLLGTEHPSVATDYSNLADALDSQGKREEALAMLRISLGIRERTLGRMHPDVGSSHNNIGDVLREMGKYEESLVELRLALDIKQKAMSPEHPMVANSISNIGEVLLEEGRFAEGEEEVKKALAIREKVLGPTHPDTASSIGDIGVARLGLKDYPAAVENLTKALAILGDKPDEPEVPAAFEFALAKALWETPGGRAAALERARGSKARYTKLPHFAKELAEVDRWIAAHPARP